MKMKHTMKTTLKSGLATLSVAMLVTFALTSCENSGSTSGVHLTPSGHTMPLPEEHYRPPLG